MSEKKQVLLIVGPTAVGKTSLSLELAHQFHGEIISGDSMQVYRGLDIGTAKVTAAERGDVPHFLIDERAVTDGFTVADFVDRAAQLINEITERGHLPIIVGGTGFYLQALLQGMHLGTPADQVVRDRWEALAKQHGNEWLWSQLKSRDEEAASHIPAGNVRRVIRALEVFDATGHSIETQTDVPDRYDALVIGLNTDRTVLYDRINQRVDQMMASGLLDEVRWLYNQGGDHLQAGRGIGYKELFGVITSNESEPDAVAKLKQNSRHYAKRQLTWFRHQMPVTWFDLVQAPATKTNIDQLVERWWKCTK
ncbi:tRNA (adenosine(37)-N6)-dimethylallyltransferase MiaA [Furfurilactobacillus siliginis]|uniref:tRNA dimethylallyltransferase n=1 Tax=Furfurilactobacillus siliginis TaxID=348151 RepID=A0A0R2L5E1_9LACO|nr:tRNA (adenosine(37)-N6)-dimethylallyltransferase MiaA [Furfurilactobacillus siliginis]KRN95062.1 tRNA delta(2)-isopentenylpyrophosphate transferase [Furfurilactobacillus siliginis]GEK28316.1 tRNA dimethylallyltransferase [Furfurilactobacillus siliginis]